MKKRNRKQTTTHKREPISRKLRFEILDRDGFQCTYCGQSAPDVVLHVDHIKPVAKGGSSDISNLTTACSACNSGKSDTVLGDGGGPKINDRDDPRWAAMEAEIISRDRKCVRCGDSESPLFVNRVIPGDNRPLWECETRDLITLCDNCYHITVECFDDIKSDLMSGFRTPFGVREMLSGLSEIIVALGIESPEFELLCESIDSIRDMRQKYLDAGIM